MSTTMQERYEGNFLEAADLPEGAVVNAVIEAIVAPDTEKDAAGKPIRKALVQFKGKSKRLVLNKTNYRVLKLLFGVDSQKWIGKEVQLQRRYLDAAQAFGQPNELTIRILPPVGTPLPKSVRVFMGHREPQNQG